MYDIYLKLLNEKGVRTADVCKATGIVPSTFSDWKKGKSIPKPDKLSLLADYFDVTVDFLLGREERIECKECGISYNPLEKESKLRHTIAHENWNKMKETYGFKWTYGEYCQYLEEAKKYVKFNQSSGDSLDTAHYDMYFKCMYWFYLYLRYFEANTSFEDFRKTYILDKIDSDIIGENARDMLIKYYKIDDSYSFDNAIISAKLSNNKNLQRILAYAEKLSPELLDSLEIQVKALAEQAKKE